MHQLSITQSDLQTIYPPSQCLHQLFEMQAEQCPDSKAVVFEGQTIDYEGLNQRANQLGHYLQTLDVDSETLVGIYTERSLETVSGILGILKAGGAYLPIDAATSPERLQYILGDAEISVLLTQESLLQRLPEPAPAHILCLDRDWSMIARHSHENIRSRVQPNNLACVIYNSDTIDQSYGILLTHYNIVRLFEATEHWFHFDHKDVWSSCASFASDSAVWELWGPLIFGGRLVIIPDWLNYTSDAFYELLRRERITVLTQTPMAFRHLVHTESWVGETGDLALQLVVLRGGAIDADSLNLWFERHDEQYPQIIAMYGTAEAGIHVTYRAVGKADLEITKRNIIGQPVPDLRLYILDEQQQPVAVGESGELYVGGAGLARGYLNRRELTRKRFIPNPVSHDSNPCLYRTRDLARFLPNGHLEHLGCIDPPIKVRGFRENEPDLLD